MRRWACSLILGAVALVPAGGRAQPAAAGDRAARDAVAAEVRLLRQAVDRLAAVTVRSHVLVSRLAIQQQRLAREQDVVDRAEDAIEGDDREQGRRRAALERASRALNDVVQEPRSELRREVESLRAEMDAHDQEIARRRARLARAEQSLRDEQQTYMRLEAALASLEQELQRPGP